MYKIALFDVDLTITKRDTFFLFILFMVYKFPFKLYLLPYLLIISLLKIFRVVSMEYFKQSWLLFISGLSEEKLNSLLEFFFENSIKPNLKSGVMEYIDALKKDGYIIIFATASFEFYIKYLSNFIGADYFFGTKTLFKNGKIMAKIVGKNCKRDEKIKRILNEIDINIKDNLDKEKSIGFSDSLVDLPFLEIVNTLYIVHPRKWEFVKTFYKKP